MRELIAKDILYARLSSGRIEKRKIVRVTASQAITGDSFRIHRKPVKGVDGVYYRSLSGSMYELETSQLKREYERQSLKHDAKLLAANIEYNRLSNEKIGELVNFLQAL